MSFAKFGGSATAVLMAAQNDPFHIFFDDCRAFGLAVGAVAVGVLLMACSDAKPIDFYKNHGNERAQRLNACLANGSGAQDCLNARQAEFEVRGIPATNGVADASR
jgi:hypothetical protein